MSHNRLASVDILRYYTKLRSRGEKPPQALALARHELELRAWERAGYDDTRVDRYAYTYIWRGPTVPPGRFRAALEAMDADLSRWSIALTVSPDWDTAEGPEAEATNAGLGVWWSEDEPDEVGANLADYWRDPGEWRHAADTRPHGGRVHYADTGITRGHRRRSATETLYVYYAPNYAAKYWVPKGTPRGLVEQTAKEGAGKSAEAIAHALERKYRGEGHAPVHAYVAVLWDDEEVGADSCGGIDTDPYHTDPSYTLVALDLLDSALDAARQWCEQAVIQGIEGAARRAKGEAAECARLGVDAAAGADNPQRLYPAAAYKGACGA